MKTNLAYLSIPVLAKYNVMSADNTPYVLGGLNIGLLMASETEYESSMTIMGITADTSFTEDSKDSTSSLDLALNFGVGYTMTMGEHKVYGEIQYSMGLSDIEPNYSDFTVKNKSIIIGLGFIF